MAGQFVQVNIEGTGISTIIDRTRLVQISYFPEVEFERIHSRVSSKYLLLGTVVVETCYVPNVAEGDDPFTMMLQVTLLRVEGGSEVATHEFDRRFRRFLEEQAKSICTQIRIGLRKDCDEVTVTLPYDPLSTHGPEIIPK